MKFPAGILATLLTSAALQGCALHMMDRITKPEDLTPAQIKAFNDMGMMTVACFALGGPPVAGNAAIILWPMKIPLPARFGPSCTIIPIGPQ